VLVRGDGAVDTGPVLSTEMAMATSAIQFVFFVLGGVLQFIFICIMINAILSWLVAFDVINVYNRFANSLLRFLDAVTRPVLRPFQRLIPPLGGVDISPVLAILVLMGVKDILLPGLERVLIGATLV